MTDSPILVGAFWDAEAEVWVAKTNDLTGLAIEADTVDELQTKVKNAVFDLLALNDQATEPTEITIKIIETPQERAARGN